MLTENEDQTNILSPVKLLQDLICFNTTNPPGNEDECIRYLYNLITDAGIETKVLGKNPKRTNLIARLKGTGSAPPFLMYGHIDVVTTEGQKWTHSPFSGTIDDGCIYGRGTLDMKSAVAMMVSALIKMKVSKLTPPGDIILCIVGDEEVDGTYGAKYIVEEYADLFNNVKYAIGEIGGFTMYISGKKFYPIMVAEKQRCCLKVAIKGPGGHGSMPMNGGAMAKLGSILNILDKRKLPVHVTPPVKMMITELANHLDFPAGMLLKGLTKPAACDTILKLLGDKGKFFDPILHNTVNATIVKGGNKINVIPSEVTLELDGRILPGYKVDDMLGELKSLIGDLGEIEVTGYDPGPASLDLGMFNTLAEILKEEDKDGIPIPFVVSGVTDARFFAKLGIQTYGFTPMMLPKDIDFSKLIHSADERIPLEAVEFGVNAIFKLLQRL